MSIKNKGLAPLLLKVCCWGVFMYALPLSAADVAGNILTSQGVTTLQRTGVPARITGAGEVLQVGDILSTGPGSIAMIQLSDGSRMTLRPGTVFAVEQFTIDAGKESAALRLFKGGLRALTGFISKRNPGAVQVRTQTATIGIRGTDFDARICDKDCQAESRALAGKNLPVIARVALIKGAVFALNSDKQRRSLAAGDPLYSGEIIETGAEGMAVVAFADQTRLTLQPESQFKIDQYYFKNERERDRSVFSLIKGAMRMVTGLIGKKNPKDVRIGTRVATIGIRGTGLDASCGGVCAAQPPGGGQSNPQDGLFLHTWSGTTTLSTSQGSLTLPAGSTGFVGSTVALPLPLTALPNFMAVNPAPRPDTIPPPAPEQFGSAASPPVAQQTGAGNAASPPGSSGTPLTSGRESGLASGEGATGSDGEGLHVWVREGQVTLQQAGQIISLGAGQSGFAGQAQMPPVLLSVPPVFMRLDPTPRPTPQAVQIPGSSTLNRAGATGTQSTTCEVR